MLLFKNMNLIVGLGNPGEKYKNTRHNAGFQAIDQIAEAFQFPKFFLQSNVKISKGKINQKEIILAKPEMFMNNSGKAIKSLFLKYKIRSVKNIIIIHDDIDIPLGEFKIQENRGSGGHKGVQSAIDAFGAKDFKRIRIGICPQTGKPKETERFVLQKFAKREEEILKIIMPEITKRIEEIIE